MRYEVRLQRSEEGYSVSVPGLPGCWSQGETEAEALENIGSAIEEYFAARAGSVSPTINTEAQSLKAAMDVFARRSPFDVLDSSDIEWLSEKLATLPNPTVLGQVFLEMDKAGDARGLKMRETMADLVEDFRQRQEKGQFL